MEFPREKAREAPTPAEVARLDQVNLWLERRKAYVATHVLRMGRVRFTDLVDTAGVRVTDGKVDLFFNREFFGNLKLVELTAVLLHEALHVIFRHQSRAERIENNWLRRLFGYACEAVINDTIRRYFPEVELPLDPITGPSLVGRDTSDLSADQVVSLLREQAASSREIPLLACLDDHDVWDPVDDETGEPEVEPRWTGLSDEMVDAIRRSNPRSKLWGSKALGQSRLPSRCRGRTDLKRFLTEQMRPAHRYATTWSHPNRKALSIYPDVILPVYEPDSWLVRVLCAIDASGSVSDEFLGVARSVANQQLPGTRLTMISFDTRAYPMERGATTMRGGGGTDAGAVERFIVEEMTGYPDFVFVFTDGYTPKPEPRFPGRWIWLLPPDGCRTQIPEGSRVFHFDPVR